MLELLWYIVPFDWTKNVFQNEMVLFDYKMYFNVNQFRILYNISGARDIVISVMLLSHIL